MSQDTNYIFTLALLFCDAAGIKHVFVMWSDRRGSLLAICALRKLRYRGMDKPDPTLLYHTTRGHNIRSTERYHRLFPGITISAIKKTSDFYGVWRVS